MSKERQIEEIYRILLDGCNGIDCYECEGNGKKDGCLHYHNANALYNAGYRKADEVAREIIEEIELLLRIVKIPCINAEGIVTPMQSGYWAIDPNDYNELKKKYTESENE